MSRINVTQDQEILILYDNKYYVKHCLYCGTTWDGNAQHYCIETMESSQEDDQEIILIDNEEDQEE